jgi:hypothetical protein
MIDHLPGPLRPWVVAAARCGGLGQKLEVGHGLGSMAHRGTDAIIPSVTTSNHNNVLSACVDVVIVLKLGVEQGRRVEL